MIVPQMQPRAGESLTDEQEGDNIEVVLPGEEGEAAAPPAEPTEDELHEEFYKNLAEDLSDSILGSISEEVSELFDNDLRSRKEWERIYEEGVELLGLGIEERVEPFDGACGVIHPLMAEAAIRFQAESITEIFSAQGICKATLIGKTDEQKEKAAGRVENDINWRLTTQMKEYRPEHERMLWNLAIMGSAFKKVYFDPSLGRQTSVFVSAEDLVAPYGATDISTAPRLAHRMKKSLNDIKKLQNAGFYRDIDLEEPPQNSVKDVKDKLTGVVAVKDDRLTLIEMHVDLEIEGYEDVDEAGEQTGVMLPYVVTFDLHSKDILAIYRNWKMDDQAKVRVQHFAHYIYIPGFGFYGMGLVHLVGGFAKSATSLLRQLIDAGTLANLPAGFKTKGIRVQRDGDPLQPGEFRDVDVPSGALRDNLIPLPFKEPSQTLLTLFGEVVEEGRRMAAVSDLNAADMNQQAPVGTTLAILERSLKVMTAVQARLHASLKEELGLLKGIIKDQLPDEYDYDVDEGRQVKKADYDIVEIIPVSDPNAATMSQRVVQYQAVIQMAQANPSIYDQVELNRQMCVTLGVKNVEKLIPSSAEQVPQDPITENQAIINGKPVKAFANQDHESHLKAHLAAQQDPKMAQLLGQMPNAQAIAAAGNAHIAEHVAFEYRRRIEQQMGVPLPQDGAPLDPNVERQLSVAMAQAAQQLLQQHQTEAAQQAAQQAAQDPVLQQQQAQLKIDQEKNQIAKYKIDKDYEIEMKRLLAASIKVDAEHQHQEKTNAVNALSKAAIADAAHAGQESSPEQQALELKQAQEKHAMALAQQGQNLMHQEQAHQVKLGQAQELHQQRIQQAEEKRRVAAAVAAARPHLKEVK